MKITFLSGSAAVHFLFILFGLWIIWMAQDLPGGGNMMPEFAAAGIIIFSVAQVIREILVIRRNSDAVRIFPPFSVGFLRALMIFAITIAYVTAMFYLGYFATTFLFIPAAAIALGVKNPKAIALTAFILVPLLYAFFILFLGARLPNGFLI